MAGEVLSRDERDGLLLRFPLEHLGSSHQKYLSDLLDTCDALELRAEAAEREVAVKTSAAEILGDQVVNSECENAALRLKLSTAERDRDVLVAAMRSVFSDDKAGWLKIYDTDDVGVAAFCQCYHLSRADFDRLILNIAADAKGKTDG